MFTGAYWGPVGRVDAGPRPTFSEARARLLADVAARLGKPVEALKGWEDYDPISLDESAYHLSRGQSGVRWTGD